MFSDVEHLLSLNEYETPHPIQQNATSFDVVTELPNFNRKSSPVISPSLSHLHVGLRGNNEDSFPRDQVVMMEWTNEAVYRFLPKSETVEAVIFADDSVINSSHECQFFHHCIFVV
jgi:hypothetical protein